MNIFKYPLETEGQQFISLPKGAEVLTVQVQNSKPCIWALVNPELITELREFRVFGTGHPIDCSRAELKYIGTYQLLEGRFIGHLFERVKR